MGIPVFFTQYLPFSDLLLFRSPHHGDETSEVAMRRFSTILIFFAITSFSVLFACEFDYQVTDRNGNTMQLTSSQPLVLTQGESYTFHIAFYEDHRNCAVPPSDTLFMINGARWRPGRDAQGLVLDSAFVWKEESSRLNSGVATFSATVSGTYTLEVIRVCDRGGFTDDLTIIVGG